VSAQSGGDTDFNDREGTGVADVKVARRRRIVDGTEDFMANRVRWDVGRIESSGVDGAKVYSTASDVS
jgi:hypothetical protein